MIDMTEKERRVKMEEYNYKLENALKKAVSDNKRRMQLNTRIDAENAIWFVIDLLNAYGDNEML